MNINCFLKFNIQNLYSQEENCNFTGRGNEIYFHLETHVVKCPKCDQFFERGKWNRTSYNFALGAFENARRHQKRCGERSRRKVEQFWSFILNNYCSVILAEHFLFKTFFYHIFSLTLKQIFIWEFKIRSKNLNFCRGLKK